MSVSLNNVGFVLNGTPVPWAAVRAIAAYKHDLFIYDDICLAFRIGDAWVEVSEEQPGFRELVTEMQRRYPEVAEDWLGEVMVPAFATNYRVLWGEA